MHFRQWNMLKKALHIGRMLGLEACKGWMYALGKYSQNVRDSDNARGFNNLYPVGPAFPCLDVVGLARSKAGHHTVETLMLFWVANLHHRSWERAAFCPNGYVNIVYVDIDSDIKSRIEIWHGDRARWISSRTLSWNQGPRPLYRNPAWPFLTASGGWRGCQAKEN